MTDGALLLLLMAAIFSVFMCAVRRGGSVSDLDCAAFLIIAAFSDASAASGPSYLPGTNGGTD